MSKVKNLCEHGLGSAYCKSCKSVYDSKYKDKRQEQYYVWLEFNGCATCGFSHRYALEVHHLATEYKRYGRSQSHIHNKEDVDNGLAIILCGNCHNIFHGLFGGKMKKFPKLTKDETSDLIMKERNPK